MREALRSSFYIEDGDDVGIVHPLPADSLVSLLHRAPGPVMPIAAVSSVG
jgi:hypothetical protein